MTQRPLADSGLSISPIALGGNVFGWTADEAASFAILDAFVDAGGTMIDTADVYSAWAPGHVGGESERVIGAWLRRNPAKRDKVIIATKVGMISGLKPDTIAAAAEASLDRMGIEVIDLYYQHKDDPEVPLADSLGAFEALRAAGKIRSTGLSNFEADRLTAAVATADREGFARPSTLQCWYNLMEREKFEGPLRDAAAAAGMAVCPFYSLANGFLSGKYREQGDLAKSVRGARSFEYVDSAKGKAVLAALDDVAAQTGAALATVALAWTKAKPGITAPIASATSLTQAAELIAALTLDLTPGQIEQLDVASA